jgi:hypothetical protein
MCERESADEGEIMSIIDPAATELPATQPVDITAVMEQLTAQGATEGTQP